MIHIKNALVYGPDFKFSSKSLFVKDGVLTDPPALAPVHTIDAHGLYIIPGLVDIHLHGACGHDFMEGSVESLRMITRYEASNGITSICPATMTMPYSDIDKACASAAAFIPEKNEASVEGVYMEGPFVNPKKVGAQNPDYLHEPDADTVIGLNSKYQNIKFVALAPELPNGLETITELHKKNIRTSIAHTCADFDLSCKAISAGANHLTHLFNAMPGLHHRNPGPIAAASDADFCEVELICDGFHIHPAIVRIAFRIFCDEQIIFISDSMMATGLDDGSYFLGGLKVQVKKRKATLCDGTLAGSATNLFECMTNAVKMMNIPLESAVKCCTFNPSRAIGIIDKVGTIEPGKRADLLFLDKDLHLKEVMIRGIPYGHSPLF